MLKNKRFGIKLAMVAVLLPSAGVFAMKDVSVREYGARGNEYRDDTVAFQKALDDVINAGGGKIYVPPGDYIISKKLTVKVPTARNKTGKLPLSLEGAGPEASRLMSLGTEGLFHFESNISGIDLTVRDMAFMAKNPGAGVALKIVSPTRGVRVERGVVIERVQISGIYTNSYFDIGISMSGQWRPLIRDVIIKGAESDSLADDSPLFAMKIGIQQNAFYAGRFVDCHVSNCETAYSWVAEENGEGFVVMNSTADRCRVGAVISTPEQEPGGCLANSRICARDVGVKIDHKRTLQVVGNEISPLEKTGKYPFIDVMVSNSWAIQINRNRFLGSSENRTHIKVDGRGDPRNYSVMPFSKFIQINNNQFCLPVDKALVYSGTDIFSVNLAENEVIQGE